MKNKKWIIWLIIGIILTFLMVGCLGTKGSNWSFRYDVSNPCNGGDSVECANWKKNYPKEHARYEKRMIEHEKAGRFEKYNKEDSIYQEKLKAEYNKKAKRSN